MVRVEIDPGAGFCFGVEQVIRDAEERLQKGEEVFGLGEMVHNAAEMERLHTCGLKTITHEQMGSLKKGKVLFRAHGEPPSTYELAGKNRIEIIDGTCPIVARLQRKVRKAYDSMDRATEQLVIFGKPDHPETIGLVGQVNGDAVVVTSVEELGKIEPGKGVHLFSQTTMDPDRFREVEQKLEALLLNQPGVTFRSECTICGQMKKRKPGLASFASRHEVILFVSGKNSSNGKMLYEFCRSVNPLTHWISGSQEIKPVWFRGTASVGISGATSTSRHQLEQVRSHVKTILLTSSEDIK